MEKIARYFGGILLIAGTAIGAGMLALPVVSGLAGFFPSLGMLLSCWLVMLFSAYLFLDVNLSLEGDVNLISMSERTLGFVGKWVCWIAYLLLLYSLMAAYIAASSAMFVEAVSYFFGWVISKEISYFCLPVLFGALIYLGTHGVDVFNRWLMSALAIAYLLLIGTLPPHITPSYLLHVDIDVLPVSMLVIITSFGYHIIIPTLTTYFERSRKELVTVIFIGSLVPLVVYLLWQLVTLGIIPLEGEHSLISAYRSDDRASSVLAYFVSNPLLQYGIHLFAFFAVITSFLGVSLSLSDFLTDGFHLKKSWEGRVIALALTFIPPVFFLFTYENAFYLALDHAGALVGILLIFLPAAMAWTLTAHPFYTSYIGKSLLILMMGIGLLFVGLDIANQLGVMKELTTRYVSN